MGCKFTYLIPKSVYTEARQFMRYVQYSSSCDAPSASTFSVIVQKCTGQKFGHITIFMFLNIACLLHTQPSFI